jgi:hypothetical protein
LDFTSFKHTVDAYPDQVTPNTGDLAELYRFVGLPVESAFARREVTKALGEKIRGSFVSGQAEVRTTFRNLREELIHRHVLDGAPLDPYFSVLDNLLVPSGPDLTVGGPGSRHGPVPDETACAGRMLGINSSTCF